MQPYALNPGLHSSIRKQSKNQFVHLFLAASCYQGSAAREGGVGDGSNQPQLDSKYWKQSAAIVTAARLRDEALGRSRNPEWEHFSEKIERRYEQPAQKNPQLNNINQ